MPDIEKALCILNELSERIGDFRYSQIVDQVDKARRALTEEKPPKPEVWTVNTECYEGTHGRCWKCELHGPSSCPKRKAERVMDGKP